MRSSKKCFKCGVEKPVDDFYTHPRMKDGRLGKCKECTKSDVAAHRLENIERVRAYDRERAKRPERAKASAEISSIWRKQDRRRTKCHNAVTRAVRSGKLVREPCSWLGCSETKTIAHHESYDRPLDVVWYCQPHHKARHKQMAIDGIDP